ncbi:hypothetical protein ABZ907_18920 [Nonomuraea wenchangensis]
MASLIPAGDQHGYEVRAVGARSLVVAAGVLLAVCSLNLPAENAASSAALSAGRSSSADIPPLGTQIGEPLKGHTSSVLALAVGKRSDGTPVVVSGSFDKTIRIWNLDTGKPIGKPLKGHRQEVASLAISKRSDGTPVIISGGEEDSTVRIWNLDTGKPLGKPIVSERDIMWGVATERLRDGTPVVAATAGGIRSVVGLWNLNTGKHIKRSFTEIFTTTTDLATGKRKDGTPLVVTANTEGRTRIWSLETGKPLSKPLFSCDQCQARALAGGKRSDGTPVAVSANTDFPLPDEDTPDGKIWTYNLNTGKPIGKSIKIPATQFADIAVGQRGDGSPVIVYGDDSGNASVWDLDTGTAAGEPFAAHSGTIFAVAAGKRSDGTPVLVTGGSDKTVQVWSLGP